MIQEAEQLAPIEWHKGKAVRYAGDRLTKTNEFVYGRFVQVTKQLPTYRILDCGKWRYIKQYKPR